MNKIYLVLLFIAIIAGIYFTKQNEEIKKRHLEKIEIQIQIQKDKEEKLEKEAQEKIELEKKELERQAKIRNAIPVSVKKANFLKYMIPNVISVFNELHKTYLEVEKLISINPSDERILKLRKEYKVKNNNDLLKVLKPHPISIALAQGAMESAWGESRFFTEANNIFGIWSFNKSDKRIAAGSLRGDKTIYLKKYETLDESIRHYYRFISTGRAFREFKTLNYISNDPLLLINKLHRYSEKGKDYVKELRSMINYNKFKKYDIEIKLPIIKNIENIDIESIKKEEIKEDIQEEVKNIIVEKKEEQKEEVELLDIESIENLEIKKTISSNIANKISNINNIKNE